jgi:outer membrane protein assembly factor BamB
MKRFQWLFISVVALCLGVWVVPSFVLADEPWSTYRGNPQRTGNTDGRAGPTAPKALWVFHSKDHFIASPVPQGKNLYISGGGVFNSYFYCLPLEPGAGEVKPLWSKSTPFLKNPTVSSPGLSGDKLVFGDGMHQNNGGALHCLLADGGKTVWQLLVPGELVHLEGSPAISDGRVYIGGGNAGVLCVDLKRFGFDGKEMTPQEIEKILAAKWKELKAKYDIEKKINPCFAMPPNEEQLPRPAPVRLWQQGKDKWHVDAPVAVVGDRILVGSAFLDKEKLGDRALFCLDAKTGDVRWRTPLKLNPWGGPSIADKLVVVGGSTIPYDTRLLKGAKGDVTALNLVDGSVKWRKEVKGGIVSSVAIAGNLALATATDGKVRAFDLADGSTRWYYDAKTPFFAPPTVAGNTVYAGDLNGVIHALDLAGGAVRWTFDLGTDAAVKAPGMIYGGPIVHGGRLYVATCNLEGLHAGQPTVVVCLGDK